MGSLQNKNKDSHVQNRLTLKRKQAEIRKLGKEKAIIKFVIMAGSCYCFSTIRHSDKSFTNIISDFYVNHENRYWSSYFAYEKFYEHLNRK